MCEFRMTVPGLPVDKHVYVDCHHIFTAVMHLVYIRESGMHGEYK